jgi:hypothetical protein
MITKKESFRRSEAEIDSSERVPPVRVELTLDGF